MKEYRVVFQGLRALWRNPSISTSAKAVLFDLLLYAGTGGDSFPSQKTLADDLGFKDSRQIRNLLKELKNFGVSWQKGTFGRSNKYYFSKEIYCRITESLRKYISPNSGNKFPIEERNAVPTNIVSNNSQINSSHIQQLFEKAFKRKCTNTELRRLNELCEKYSESYVADAIKELGSRNLPYIKIGLIEKVLEDWEIDGKPTPRPVFQPCNKNGCENGHILNPERKTYVICECKENYDNKRKDWEREWGTS